MTNVCTEFWLRFEPQIRHTRLVINVLLITVRAERMVCFYVKLFDFFRGWILICLTWNLSGFFSNSVEILTWNVRKKLFQENFSEDFLQTKAILYQNLWNFALLYAIFILRPYCAENFTQVFSHVVCTQVRRHVHKRIKKRKYGEKKPGRFVFGKPVLFTLGLGLTTPYSLGVLVWNFYQMFVTMSIEFWLRFELQSYPTRLAINFLLITARAEKNVRLCVNYLIFFVGEYSFVWPEICRFLSWIQRIFLRGISVKKYFGRIFQKFSHKPRRSTKTCEISLYFMQFLFCIRIALK